MEQEYLKLKNIEYKIDEAKIDTYKEDNGIRLFIEVKASANDSNIDFELSHIYLYHNNGFLTGVSKILDLKGKRYSWLSSINDNGEEAGTLYILEHENVISGTIEIVDIISNQMIIKWEGFANVYWNEEFGENIPFETQFVVELPKTEKVRFNAYQTNRLKIDDNCEIELINFKDIEFAANKMQETREWTNFNTTLEFKIMYGDKEYLGKVIYTNGKNNYKTIIEENCPIQVKHCGFSWSTKLKEFNFTFEIFN